MTHVSTDVAVRSRHASPRQAPWGPITLRRMSFTLALYAGVLLLAGGMLQWDARAELSAVALGLAFPGGGFLAWPAADWGLVFCASSFAAFLLSLVLWFATGNVLLPFAVWGGAAFAAGLGASEGAAIAPALTFAPFALLAVAAGAAGLIVLRGHAGLARRRAPDATAAPIHMPAEAQPHRDEIAIEDLQRLRLLLDRSLQRIERFEGFEWVDQFQTAAVRYQLNAMAYALAIAGHVHLPAFDGYLLTAQRNLVRKQLNRRVWRYWQLENLWGNLRAGADPIGRDNIMFSGFLAAQIAYARGATGLRDFDAPASLTFEHRGRRHAYSQAALVELLTQRYRRAPYGLLACEPNWIYPLCNVITATAIRASDAQYGTRRWEEIAASFRHHLEREFISSDGRIVPFRSSLTGMAFPGLGGAVMQAFPCLFLNAVLPDIAQRQWQRLRAGLSEQNLRRAMWPVDVGNYRFSRASSYAASAAAAIEMGDWELAKLLLQHLDVECPLQRAGGVAHRAHASLWAHAIELIARLGHAGALRSLVTAPRVRTGPFIKQANYPDVLVAKAEARDRELVTVLHPGEGRGYKQITIAGLAPSSSHVIDWGEAHTFDADAQGEARLNIPLMGRTMLRIHPARGGA